MLYLAIYELASESAKLASLAVRCCGIRSTSKFDNLEPSKTFDKANEASRK